MRKIIFLVVIIGLISFLFCSFAEADRAAPKEVEPVIYDGIKYIAPHWGVFEGKEQNGGYIEAYDIKTGKKLWELKVYEIKYESFLEPDVQDVFITSLKIEDGKLIVVNEKGDEYEVDLEKKRVEKRKFSQEYKEQPLQLTIKSDKEVYEVGEKFVFSGQIKNISEQDIFIYPLEISLTITFDVIDSRGNKIDVAVPIIDLWPPKKDDFALLKSAKFLPKTFKAYIPIESMKPDLYTITVKYNIWQKGYYENGKFINLDAWTGTLTSNTVTVKVIEKKVISKEEALKIADAVATKELKEFNKTEHAKELGGPFLLKDYEKSIKEDTDEGRIYFWVFYEYKKPVMFFGHPEHFSVWVYRDTGEIKFFGGE